MTARISPSAPKAHSIETDDVAMAATAALLAPLYDDDDDDETETETPLSYYMYVWAGTT